MYKIVETHSDRVNRNKVTDFSTLERAKDDLNITLYLWRRNGGSIVETTENALIVEEQDGSDTIVYRIYKK